jgi:competence protein ComEC
VLIDGGGHEGDSKDLSDIGETIVIPFLLDYGVTKLDAVVATHGHNDHAQGLKAVLQSFEVDYLFVPNNQNAVELKELLQIAKEKGIPIQRSQKGDTIKLDSRTVLEVLYPESNFISMKDPLNDGSLVLKLIYGNTSVLFTGDIGMEAEAHMLKEKTNVKSDVLKVAHHGSPYSTGEGFISAVSPRAAVVSVGTNNFGHPSPSTLERLDQAGVRVFRTDREGALLFSSNGKSFKIQRTVKVN